MRLFQSSSPTRTSASVRSSRGSSELGWHLRDPKPSDDGPKASADTMDHEREKKCTIPRVPMSKPLLIKSREGAILEHAPFVKTLLPNSETYES